MEAQGVICDGCGKREERRRELERWGRLELVKPHKEGRRYRGLRRRRGAFGWRSPYTDFCGACWARVKAALKRVQSECKSDFLPAKEG